MNTDREIGVQIITLTKRHSRPAQVSDERHGRHALHVWAWEIVDFLRS